MNVTIGAVTPIFFEVGTGEPQADRRRGAILCQDGSGDRWH